MNSSKFRLVVFIDGGFLIFVSFNASLFQILVGHTEDALIQIINTFYIISAEVTSEDGDIVLEKFTTLTYPGQLPGGTMGFNHHGLVHTMNSIFPKEAFPSRTPHLFLTRAMLRAQNLRQIEELFLDEGSGTADGFSINLVVAEGKFGENPALYNIEISPNQKGKAESEINIQEISKGQCYSHCNQ